MIVLRSPKGWTGPKMVDGLQIEGTFRAHQVPILVDAEHPDHVSLLEDWMKSYRAEELFDADGKLIAALAELAPQGHAQDGCEPAHQRRPVASRPAHARFPRPCRERAGTRRDPVGRHGGPRAVPARRCQVERRAAQFQDLRPGRDAVQPSGPRLRSHRPPVGRQTGQQRRVSCTIRPRGRLHAQRASVRGVARRLFAHRTAWPVQQLRGVHPHRRFDVQPAREMAEGHAGTAVAPENRFTELPACLPCLAAGP